MAHVQGADRDQGTLFADRLDDLVAPDHAVRVIDAFVDMLDLSDLGFAKVVPAATGRPPYAPSDLLKLYVYGYLNQVRSSRKLEREARRNLEVLWLIRRVQPTFKTIADFRRDHVQAIVGVCRAFVRFCRDQKMYGGALLAIDGTKIEAVSSRKQVITPKSLARKAEVLDGRIAEYLAAMDEADREEPKAEDGPVDVASALEALRAQRETVRRQAAELAAEKETQRVPGEPEAKLMATPRRGYQVAYNAQIVVDAEHKLIAAFDLTSDGNDQGLLAPMAEQGCAALGIASDPETAAVVGAAGTDADARAAAAVTIVADTGYSNGEQGQALAAAGIFVAVPRAETINPAGRDLFTRDEFRYDAGSDSWTCPAGQVLSCRKTSVTEKEKHYWTSACALCELRPKCTKAERRTIVRSFFEDARQAMHDRTKRDPDLMRQRRSIAEHPFAIMKWMMGTPRFLLRGREKAKAELALTVLAFNLKRAIAILKVPVILQSLRAART